MKLSVMKVLSDDDKQRIHGASLKLLSETGMKIANERALRLLEDAGCEVDYEKKYVKIPPELVEECLATVPSEFKLYNSRTKEVAFNLNYIDQHPMAGGDSLYFYNYENGRRDNISKAQVEKFTKIADALPNIDIVVPAGMPQDVAPRATTLHGVDAVFANTEKPLYFPHEGIEVTKAVLEITRIVSSEKDLSKKPIAIYQVSPTSPLSWVESAVDSLMETIKSGIPCSILGQPLSGMTSPYTAASQVLLNNAEVLSGVVIGQLIDKSVPLLYGQAWITYDMQKMFVQFASPETFLERMAGNEMATFYKMPSMMCGADTDSWTLDALSGIEKGLTGLVAYSTGVNLISDFGEIASCRMASCEQLVIDSEMYDYVDRLIQGIDISDEKLAVELIDRVGPGGHFMAERHTVDMLRTDEFWKPGIYSPSNYESWTAEGMPDLVKKANQKVQEMLNTHTPEPLNEKKQEEINEIIKDFESRTK